MQIRQDGQRQRPKSLTNRNRRGRRLIGRWLPILLLLALAVVAVMAPAGQAQAGGEASPEARAQVAAQKAGEREERAAARKAQRETEKAAAKAGKSSPRGGSAGPVNITDGANSIQISCTSVVWEFHQFPSSQSNTVNEKVTFIRKGSEPVSSRSAFTFQGDSGTNTTTIDAPVGTYTIDAEARWAKSPESEGHNGFDLHAKVTCEPRASMTVTKLQKLEVPASSYVNTPLGGEPGQTIDYQILVDNTGNVPLALSAFTDLHCDEGTITGGPAGGVLAANTTTEYLCKHLITAADLTAGKYENTVQIIGTPTEELTAPVTKVSNTVEAVVVPVGANPEGSKGTGTGGSETGGTGTAPTITPTTGTSASSNGGGKTGVLGFSAASIPTLKGPQGCVRASFHASIKSAGVSSVTFYLDGHKLKKLTSHNARKGLLTIAINPSKLTLGAHRLVANITMTATATNAKAAKASRSLTVLRCHSNVVTPKFTG